MLHLTSDDLRRLQSLLSLLQEPARGPAFESWQREINRRIEELVGVDSSSTPPSSVGSATRRGDLARRRNHLQTLVALDADLQRECVGRLLICGGEADGHITDAGHVAEVARTESPGGAAADLGPHSRSEATSTVAERRREGLLQLLLPVFRSSVRVATQATPAAADIAEWVDTLSDGAAVYGPRGHRLLHANAALRQLLEGSAGEWLRTETQRAAASAAQAHGRVIRRAARQHGGRSGDGDGNATEYTFTGRQVGSQHRESDRVTLVAVAVAGLPFPDAGNLRERYGLSPREADVAVLLARGLSDRDIAAKLVISWHTARRHSERVLRKLGLASRAEVALTLLAR